MRLCFFEIRCVRRFSLRKEGLTLESTDDMNDCDDEFE